MRYIQLHPKRELVILLSTEAKNQDGYLILFLEQKYNKCAEYGRNACSNLCEEWKLRTCADFYFVEFVFKIG